MKECSKCKSNEYTNKSLVMLINECAHPLCKNCVENLYARNAAPCHICGKILRKNTFWEQVFDDPMIEKENNIRKRLRKIYNLKEDDFPTLRDFNDYLELLENIVFNLTNDLNVEGAEQEIASFKEDNSDLIEKNRKRLDTDQLWVMEQLKDEREQKKRLHEAQTADAAVVTGKLAAQRDTKAIMEELRESRLPAEAILDRERKRQIEAKMEEKEEAERKKERQKENRKRPRGGVVSFGDHRGGDHRRGGRAYVYTVPIIPINGPPPPEMEYLEHLGYLEHMRAPSDSSLAGGYISALGAARALFEARCDLLAF